MILSKVIYYIALLLHLVYSFTNVRHDFDRRSAAKMVKKHRLDDETLWQIGLTFRRKSSTDSLDINILSDSLEVMPLASVDDRKTVDVLRANLRVRFVTDRSYEPPQGRIFIEDDFNGLVRTNDFGYSGIWTLSEDKNDRRDGLWIMGLFAEPKYPYLYFYLSKANFHLLLVDLNDFVDVYDTVIVDGEEMEIFPNMKIPNSRLDFRFDHYVDKKIGVVLSNGVMTYKLSQYVKADPFGLGGKVDIGDVITAGVVNISPSTAENIVID